jgi:hypothetical protein
MSTEIKTNWPWIVRFFKKSLSSHHFYTFATVDPDGRPHIAPYASLVFNDDCTGYYSDVFPQRMARNLKKDERVCIMAVDFGAWYTLKGLFRGRFDRWPGIRLYGTVGPNRRALPEELDRWLVRVKRFKKFKGYDLIWKDIRTVRDIYFTDFEPVHLGPMTRHLQQDQKVSG